MLFVDLLGINLQEINIPAHSLLQDKFSSWLLNSCSTTYYNLPLSVGDNNLIRWELASRKEVNIIPPYNDFKFLIL